MNIHRIEYHRNGISGDPFFLVTFEDYTEGKRRNMAAIVFDEPGRIAVIDTDLLAHGTAGRSDGPEPNTWRGDVYEKDIRQAIDREICARYGRSGIAMTVGG